MLPRLLLLQFPIQVCAVLQRNGVHGWCSTGPVCPQSPGGSNLGLVAAGAWSGGAAQLRVFGMSRRTHLEEGEVERWSL